MTNVEQVLNVFSQRKRCNRPISNYFYLRNTYYNKLETWRGFGTRISELGIELDVRHQVTSSAVVGHVDEAGQLPDWGRAKVIQSNLLKQI